MTNEKPPGLERADALRDCIDPHAVSSPAARMQDEIEGREPRLVWVARHVTGGGFRVFSSEDGFFEFMKSLINNFASVPADRAFEIQCVVVDEDVPLAVK